jgi:hypothetical protein
LRHRIEAELERDQRGPRFGFAPVIALVAAAAVVIAAVLGVSAYRRSMTAEPATTVSPAPTSSTSSSTPGPSPTGSSTGSSTAGPPTQELNVRALSDGETTTLRKACEKQQAKDERTPANAKPVYARYERWASFDGPGWNQSRVLISTLPATGAWICVDDVSDVLPDYVDEIAKGIPVYEVEGSVGSTATCEHRSNDTVYAEATFQMDGSVAQARVRLNRAGRPGPWQTTAPLGGYVHFSIGLVGDDAWADSVTADYEFLDADGTPLEAMPVHDAVATDTPPVTRITEQLSTCGDMARRNSGTKAYQPPVNAAHGMTTCAALVAQAGANPGFDKRGWKLRLELPGPKVWGGVLSKDGQRFACSLAPTREVSAMVSDKPTTAESSFWFAVNPIDATGGSSFWAAGRVPGDVTSIEYVLPGEKSVPAQISADGYWMAMYHVDGKDLAQGTVSTWDPVRVTIKRSSGAPITYQIPFEENTMCNQVSHGC